MASKKNKLSEVTAKLEAAELEAKIAADERVKALQKELEQLKRKELNANTRDELVLQEAKRVLESSAPLIINLPACTKPDKDKRTSVHTEIPVLCIGDVHLGYYHATGQFAYSVEIAKARINRAIEKFLKTVASKRTYSKIEEMRLYLMGDMVEGENMRAGHSHEIEGPLIRQALFWAPEVINMILLRLLPEFRKIKVVAVPGNHGRNGPPKTDAHPLTNWDRVSYEVARTALQAALYSHGLEARWKDIEWDLPTDRVEHYDNGDDWYSIDYVFDWCNCVTHGETLRGRSWGGLPYYAIERLARRYADILDDQIDYLYLGHIHVDASIPSNFRAIFVNGAVESSTGFIRKDLISAAPPSQSAVFYDRDHGHISRHLFHLQDDIKIPQWKRVEKAIAKRQKT